MAEAFHVAGPAIVKITALGGTSPTLETLGYTANGADVTLESHFENVPCDENGGEQGPPAELVYLGERATVRLELTKWDEGVADLIRPRLSNGTAGTVGTPGTLVFANTYEYRLLIASTNQPYNFTRAVPRSAISINKGTRHSRLLLEFECYKDASGYLWNTTTS